MSKTVLLHNGTISVEIRKSNRARRMRVAVYCDGNVVAIQPSHIGFSRFLAVLEQKVSWIQEKLKFYNGKDFTITIRHSNAERLKLVADAKQIAQERIDYFNQFYKFRYNKVFIKDQKTRWGSCSSKGNLSFNYRIAVLAKELQDYLIVHELCHLKQFNHSKEFWNLVQQTIPNYRELHAKLKS